jgi:hypothetical protein
MPQMDVWVLAELDNVVPCKTYVTGHFKCIGVVR